MAGILPGSTFPISFGRVNQAFSNYAPGTGGSANGTTSTGGGYNIKLSAVLGFHYGGKSVGALISFSTTFGGIVTPYTY